jgi:alkylation response protein AidB-like acyl-CoA dehydrogenase
MSAGTAPPSHELVDRAEKLVPLIAAKAEWSEENRRIHDEIIDGLAQAGVFRMRRPARYGGHETDSRTLVDVIATIARGDGSTAWNVSVWLISNWIAAMFPDHVQDEVFADPDTRVCAALSPSAAATPADHGLVVNGSWQFISGAAHSRWQVIVAMAPAPDGGQWPVFAVVPMSQLRIVDDWYASGLSATGSVTTVAEDLYVPLDRVLPLPAVMQGRYASVVNASSPVFNGPFVPTGCAGFGGVALGMAQAAQTAFFERLPGRRITYTTYDEQGAAPVTHFQVAEAALKADEAAFHAYRIANMLDEKGASGEPWTLRERVLARVSLGRTFHLVRDAVDVLSAASGGSAIYRSAPIQRIQRDAHALNRHALMYPSTNYELYGRVLCGHEPNTAYL